RHQPMASQNTNTQSVTYVITYPSNNTPIPPTSYQFARLFVFKLHVRSQTNRDNRHAGA
ncbi:hypothetical protein M405DRAFT_828960, partial [Rhizopogon salebrosus TDB-379]